MKVLFANGPWVDDSEKYGLRAGSRWPHLRLKKDQLQYYPFPFYMAYAAAVAKEAGHEVLIRDCIAEGMGIHAFMEWVDRERPRVVLLETSTPSIKNDLVLARAVKDAVGAVIVMAGPHATAMPGEVLLNHQVDYITFNEYDYSLRNLLAALEKGQDPRGLNGVHSRNDDGSVRLNPPEARIPDLNQVPFPLREGLPMHRYNDPFCKHAPNVSMMASRGCPYNCSFCVEPTLFYDAPNYRLRSAASVVNEMELCQKEYGAREIYFDDSSFSVNQKQVVAICDEIERRGLKIYWSAMADATLKKPTLERMKRAGCVALKFGLESADEQILKNVNKRHINLDMVRNMVVAANEAGIETHATYIFGLPGETKQTMEATKKFAFSLGTTTSQFAACIPIPGTTLFKQAKEKDWLTTYDWEKYDGCHEAVLEYPDLPSAEIIKAVRDCRRRLIWKVLFNPLQLAGYLRMIYKLSGLRGLFSTAWEKSLYLARG